MEGSYVGLEGLVARLTKREGPTLCCEICINKDSDKHIYLVCIIFNSAPLFGIVGRLTHFIVYMHCYSMGRSEIWDKFHEL